MNDDYIITRSNGQQYEYDADFDIYRRVPEPMKETHLLRWGWAYVSVFALVFSAYITWVK